MTIAVRGAELRDASAIGRIVKAAYAKWVPIIGREPLPMQVDYFVVVPQQLAKFTVATKNDEILGLIEMELRDDHIWIENVAVAPESQGQGIGRRLLMQAEIYATSEAVSSIRLLTNGDFTANIQLYKNMAYEVDQVADFRGGKVIYMSKNIF